VAEKYVGLGYDQAKALKGGVEAWKKAGLTLAERSAPPAFTSRANEQERR